VFQQLFICTIITIIVCWAAPNLVLIFTSKR